MTETQMETSYASSAIPAGDVLDAVPARLQPEKRLLLAVLEGAVTDFQKYATASSGRGMGSDSQAGPAFAFTRWSRKIADQSIDSSPIMIQVGLTQLWPRASMTSQ